MLNRSAESFYWVGRYTERIDYMARLLNVNYYTHSSLLEEKTKTFTSILSELPSEKKQEIFTNDKELLNFMAFDRTYMNSIINCLANARENVRVVRQLASTRMWDTLNRFYLWFLEQNQENNLEKMPYLFLQKIRQEICLFQSIADSSMLHEIDWHFLQAGEQVEKIENTIRMVRNLLNDSDRVASTDENQYYLCLSMLESTDGYEAFRKVHANDVTLERIIDFLFLNSVYPGSVYYSVVRLEENLRSMQTEFESEHIKNLIRLVSKYRTLLFQVVDLRGKTVEQFHEFLDGVLIGCNRIGIEVEKCFNQDREREVIETTPRKLVEMV